MRGVRFIKMLKTHTNHSATHWLNALKVAILNKNQAVALHLIENLPEFDDLKDLLCAKELVSQVLEWLMCEKTELAIKMEKLKQQKRFLNEI